MDWGKAKNVILIFLAITNIFLIGVYGARYANRQESSSELYSYTIEQLEANDIQLRCSIPEKPAGIPALTVQYEENCSEETMASAIKKISDAEEPADSRNEYEEMAGMFLRECGLSERDAVVAEVEEREDGSVAVRYENHYDKIPLQECYMDVIFREGYVCDLQRFWVSAVEEGTARLEITEPVIALLSFIDIVNEERAVDIPEESSVPKTSAQAYAGAVSSGEEAAENDIPQEENVPPAEITEVENMRLVYYTDRSGVTESILYDTAFPAWQIQYDDGRIRYISAFEQ